MKDPYSVLGISPSATDAEVKRAYHDLVRKYHPDNFMGNELADLAQEKMKEINEANEEITRSRQNQSQSNGSAYGWSGPTGGGMGGYAQVRQCIASGRIAEAEQLLQAIQNRDAEWYYLMGGVCFRKGWFDEAMRHIDRACTMDPNNAEYRQAQHQMRSGAHRPGGYGGAYQSSRGLSACDCCTSLMCADLCCGCSRSCC